MGHHKLCHVRGVRNGDRVALRCELCRHGGKVHLAVGSERRCSRRQHVGRLIRNVREELIGQVESWLLDAAELADRLAKHRVRTATAVEDGDLAPTTKVQHDSGQRLGMLRPNWLRHNWLRPRGLDHPRAGSAPENTARCAHVCFCTGARALEKRPRVGAQQ